MRRLTGENGYKIAKKLILEGNLDCLKSCSINNLRALLADEDVSSVHHNVIVTAIDKAYADLKPSKTKESTLLTLKEHK